MDQKLLTGTNTAGHCINKTKNSKKILQGSITKFIQNTIY